MSKQEKLVKDDESTEPVDREGAQTSNKAGLHSDAQKPSNAGPDAHEEHKAPVSGAFGSDKLLDHVKKEKGA